MSPEEQLLLEKIIYTSFIVPLLLCITLVWLLLVFLRRRHRTEIERKEAELREQKLLLEKQEALQAERNRIAAEMHDDLGGGLTSIKYLAHRAIRNMDNSKDRDIAFKIVNHSTKLISNMRDIIWAMDSAKDNIQSFVDYVIPFSKDFMGDHEIQFDVNINGEVPNSVLTGEQRRHLFLVIKEALHNIVKHARASAAELEILFTSEDFNLIIKDNGIGIRQNDRNGHGLINMQNRVEELSGRMELVGPPGTEILIGIPYAYNKS